MHPSRWTFAIWQGGRVGPRNGGTARYEQGVGLGLFRKRERETTDAELSAKLEEFWRWWDSAAASWPPC